jgi:polysaccharide biosynthesis PFTS motif protein
MKTDGFAKDLPNYRYMQLDVHWVWTQGFSKYLAERGGRSKRVEVVGPVTWYLPEALPKCTTRIFRIAVFDITPISDAYAESIGLLTNYYCPSTAMGFLNGVLEAAATLRESELVECVVNLKHKRQYSTTHDQGYIDHVSRKFELGEINLIPFDINIYSFIADSDVVVVIPNSSPAYIASTLSVPSIYFDPTTDMKPTFEPAFGLSFASGADALCEQLIDIYRAKHTGSHPYAADMDLTSD